MAFNVQNLVRLHQGPEAFYVYNASGDDTSGAGYFNDLVDELNVDSQILVALDGGTPVVSLWQVTSNDGTTVVVTSRRLAA